MIATLTCRASTFVISLNFVQRLMFLFSMGAFGVLALPPIHWVPVVLLSFWALLWGIEQAESPKQAFLYGWTFGAGYFIAGMYWLAYPLKIVGYWYLMPFGAIGLPLVLALFPAMAVYFTFLLSSSRLGRVLMLSLTWSIFEWLRGHLLTGLPWNLLGYVWDLHLLQSTSIFGIYGLSLLTVLWATSLFSRNKIWVFVVWTSMAVVWGHGYYRLKGAGETALTSTNLRLIQASIPQDKKWSPEHLRQVIEKQIALSYLNYEESLKAIIWAEASVPVLVEQHPQLIATLADVAPPNGYLLFGAPRHPAEQPTQIRTSLFALNSEGKIAATYDKAHLVPFGEYVPLGNLLGFSKLTAGERDFSPGPGLETLIVPGLPSFGPLICYEAIFPGDVVKSAQPQRPEWLLNLTNDAWYGHTSGPYQHLEIVRTRAIEEGLPLVRATNNGISAVVDPYGRILHRLELDEIGYIDFALPKALAGVTVYGQYGDNIFFVLLLMLSFIGRIVERRSKNMSIKYENMINDDH